MPIPTEPLSEQGRSVSNPHGSDCGTASGGEPNSRPRGYTMADEEMEQLEEKRMSGNVLDPIALKDPIGQSVEKVVLRVGVAVVVVLVVGILVAQVACKNIQLSGITDFSLTEVTAETVDNALRKGIVWGGEITHFPDGAHAVFDAGEKTVTVTVENAWARTIEQVAASAEPQALALAMNLFRDEGVDRVVYTARGPVSAETGAFDSSANEGLYGDVLVITWTRNADDPSSYSCSMAGFDPVASSVKTGIEESVPRA